ncbi:MAG: PQQ-binding-like beta-propeller repeat protein [Thermoplasmatales archaeon]|nr:MAG: PQQ-binding-like beta-propeller repeat protein [Thermoplasmatales archaeon]
MRRVGILSFFLFMLVLSAFTISAQPAGSPWPMFRMDAKHSGISTYDTSHVDGTILWTFETGDGIESSPAIGSDGTIYIGSHDGYLYAINPDGTEKWRFDAGPPRYDARWDVSKSIMATPAIAADGTIYVYSSANYLFAVNSDGTEKWRHYLLWGNDFWTSPTIGDDGTIYIGSANSQSTEGFDAGLHAINSDGTEKWKFENTCGVTTAAAIGDDGTIYFGGNINREGEQSGNYGMVYALSPIDGTELWNFQIENWMESSPAIGSNGTIYIGSGREARIYVLNPDGSEKWRHTFTEGLSCTPLEAEDGSVYVGVWDTNFTKFTNDGIEIWRYRTPEAFEGIISSPAIGADGTIYVGCNAGVFYAFNPNGTIKWTVNTEGRGVCSSPAIGADGTIYFGSWDKKLYAIGGSATDDEQDEDGASNGTDDKNQSQEQDNNILDSKDEAPGFEGIMLFVAILVILYFIRNKNR